MQTGQAIDIFTPSHFFLLIGLMELRAYRANMSLRTCIYASSPVEAGEEPTKMDWKEDR